MSNLPSADALCEAFRARMRATLSGEQLREIDKRNASPEYADGCCASHDFCDANLIMDDAGASLGLEFGEAPGCAAAEAEATLWADAWNLAIEKGFAP